MGRPSGNIGSVGADQIQRGRAQSKRSNWRLRNGGWRRRPSPGLSQVVTIYIYIYIQTHIVYKYIRIYFFFCFYHPLALANPLLYKPWPFILVHRKSLDNVIRQRLWRHISSYTGKTSVPRSLLLFVSITAHV